MLWTGGVPIAACLVTLVGFAACTPSEPVDSFSAALVEDTDSGMSAAISGQAQCEYWADGIPKSISVQIGDDYATYVYTPSEDGGSIVLELSVDGAGTLHVEGPSSDHPGEVEAWSTIEGNGLVELRAENGALTFATLDGRALDLESPSTHYADGAPIELEDPLGFPDDVNARASSLMEELVAGLAQCFGIPAPFSALAADSASCPGPAIVGSILGLGVGGEACAGCLGGALTSLGTCMLAAGGTCSAGGPFAWLCIILTYVVCFAVFIFATIACLNGGTCCPVRCGEGPAALPRCCRQGAMCVDQDQGLCCEVSCGGMCCPTGSSCASAPDLAGELSCGSATVCCPPQQQCGSTCCASPDMCSDLQNGPCCEGMRGSPGGPCPGAPGSESIPANCCGLEEMCADGGTCCEAGTQCEGHGTCCPSGFECSDLAGARCCPEGSLFCPCDTFPGTMCFAGATCPMSSVGEPVLCELGTQPIPSVHP